MITCSQCNRHYKSDAEQCPFCAGRTMPRGVQKALNVMGGAVTTVILAACYGGAPDDMYVDTGDDTGTTDTGSTDTGVSEDLDADGFSSDVDCDDTNADIHPEQTEDCTDTIDNDCDELIDAADDECAG